MWFGDLNPCLWRVDGKQRSNQHQFKTPVGGWLKPAFFEPSRLSALPVAAPRLALAHALACDRATHRFQHPLNTSLHVLCSLSLNGPLTRMLSFLKGALMPQQELLGLVGLFQMRLCGLGAQQETHDDGVTRAFSSQHVRHRSPMKTAQSLVSLANMGNTACASHAIPAD